MAKSLEFHYFYQALSYGDLEVKNPPAVKETWEMGFDPWLGRSSGEGNCNPLQYSCPENPHGQRSLAGYSPWADKESDTTEQLSTHSVY